MRSCEERRELALARSSFPTALNGPFVHGQGKLNPITASGQAGSPAPASQKHPPHQPWGIVASGTTPHPPPPEPQDPAALLYEVLFCFSKRQKHPSGAAAVPALKVFWDVLASIPKKALGKVTLFWALVGDAPLPHAHLPILFF